MNDLSHRHEVNVVVVGENFINPVEESVEEFGVVFQPGGVVVKTERGTVLIVVTLEVMVKECVELIT